MLSHLEDTDDDITSMTVENSTNSMLRLTPPPGCIILQYLGYVPWDNPQDSVSLQLRNMFGNYVNGLILPVLFLISTPTNCLNMAVFYKQGLKDRIHLCLFWLAFADLLLMWEMFCTYIDLVYALSTNALITSSTSVQFFIKNKLLFLNGFSWVTAFTMTIIACERCFCVVSPFHARHFLKTKTMAVLLFFSSGIIMGGYYVVAMKWSLVCIFDPVTNATVTFTYPSKEYMSNKELIDMIEGNVYGLLMPGFCISVVSATTVVTMLRLRKMAAWRAHSASSSSDLMSSRDLALTRTLVLICIVFVACYIPVIVFHNAGRMFPELRLGGRLHNTYSLLVTIAQLCMYVNFSFNFFIYYKTGSRFRETTRDLVYSITCRSSTRPIASYAKKIKPICISSGGGSGGGGIC